MYNQKFRAEFLVCDVDWTDSPIDKGKAIPLQAWTGSEGYRRLRFPDFKTIGT
jgi:hypothetical protein